MTRTDITLRAVRAAGYVVGTPATLILEAKRLWRWAKDKVFPPGICPTPRQKMPNFELWNVGPSISLDEVKQRRFMSPEQMAELQAERRRLLDVLQQRQVVNSPTAWERLLGG